MEPLLWMLLIFAAGFARYFVLGVRDVDGQLAAAATVFVPVCTVAAAELFGGRGEGEKLGGQSLR